MEKQKDTNLNTIAARSNEHGFPRATRIKRTVILIKFLIKRLKHFLVVLFEKNQGKTLGKSLFALSKNKQKPSTEQDAPKIENLNISDSAESSMKFGQKSYIISNDEANSIHEDNVKYLSNLNEQEILQERQQLLSTLGK